MNPLRIAHLSDLHLGYRAFRKTERGWNLRERDVASAFHSAIQELVRIRPALVLLSGDLFDRPDPPSTAFLTIARGIRTLQEALPGLAILAIAGERDSPAAPADPGPIAVLDAMAGVDAAAGAPRAVRVASVGVHVLLVPCRATIRPPFPRLRPDPDARWNVLLLRGEPSEAGTEAAGESSAASSRPLSVDPSGWDYVALGGGHRARIWDGDAGRVRTAGSLERIGCDPWREAASQKGFWTFDLVSGEGEFHPVAGRPVIDLAPVRVDPADPASGSRRLRHLLQGLPGGVEGKILRVRLRGAGGTAVDGVLPGLLDAVRRRTAHLELEQGPTDLGLPGLLAAETDGGSGPCRLSWTIGADGGDPDGTTVLEPGLWALVADHPDERRRIARMLTGERYASSERGSGGEVEFRLETSHMPAGPRRASRSDAPAGEVRRENDRAGGHDTAGEPSPAPSLRVLRADWIEAAGDLEVQNLEWVRERQEAESRLTAYRDRARELRERLREIEEEGMASECPACHRPLGDAGSRMVTELREEWEDVVQDGRWWRRRREQLEDKPQPLKDLDRRVLELQSRMEAAARTPTGDDGPGPRARPGPAGEMEVRLTPSAGSVDRALGMAGDFLGRATEGRIRGLVAGDGPGEYLVRDDRGGIHPPTGADRPLLSAALQLARLERPPLHVLPQFAGSEANDDVVRFLELLGSEQPGIPVLVVLPPAVAERIPELLRGVISLRSGDGERPRIRAKGPGRARVELQGAGGAV